MASAWEETKKKVLAKSAWQQTRQKVLNESRNYEAPAAQSTAAPAKTPSTTQSSLEVERSRILSGVTDRASAARALDEVSRLSKLIDYSGATYEDKFTGQFGASYAQGRLSQDASLAWDQYLSSPTAENRKKAEEASEVLKQFQTRNEKALDDDATLSWVSQSLAGYLPQLADQTKYSAAGATVGGIAGSAVPVVGTAAGIKAGIVAGSGAYSFSTMRGAAFKDLLDLGVDERTARELATDEAVISSLIEMADTGVDIATLGVGKVINVAAKGGLKSLVKSGAGEAVEKAGKKLLSAVKKYGGKAGVQYALNIGGEMLEEGAQQSVSIANRERAANRNTSGVTGLLGETVSTAWDAATGKNTDARTEIWEAMKEGGKIAAMMGGATMVGTNLIQRGLGKSESASKEVAPSPVEQPKVEKAVDKAQAVSYDKTVETTEVTVENKATSLYAALGMKLKKAEAKAAVVQKLIDGKEVTRGELLSLNLSDAKYQSIFTELTGVTFEKGMNDDQRFNAARTAHEVRKSVASEPQMVQERVTTPAAVNGRTALIPQEIVRAAEDGMEVVSEVAEARDPGEGPADSEHFAQAYRDRKNPQAGEPELREAYNEYLEFTSDPRTFTLENGVPVDKPSLRRMVKMVTGKDATPEELNALFDALAQDAQAREESELNGIRYDMTEEETDNGAETDREAQADPGRESGDDEARTRFSAAAGERGQVVRVFEGTRGANRGGARAPVVLGAYSAVQEPSQTARETVTELEALGVPAFIHAGDWEILLNGAPSKVGGDAATIYGSATGVPNDIAVPPLETAGHEGYHYYRGAAEREAYTTVVSENIDLGSDAFVELFDHINDKYFEGQYDSGIEAHVRVFREELTAYVSGYIHNNAVPEGLLLDESAVREAWNEFTNTVKEGVSEDGVQAGKRSGSVEEDVSRDSEAGAGVSAQDGKRGSDSRGGRGRNGNRDADVDVRGLDEEETQVRNKGAAAAEEQTGAPFVLEQPVDFPVFQSWEEAFFEMGKDRSYNLEIGDPPNLFPEVSVGYVSEGRWKELASYPNTKKGLEQFNKDIPKLMEKSDPDVLSGAVKVKYGKEQYQLLTEPASTLGLGKAEKDAARVGISLRVVKGKFMKSPDGTRRNINGFTATRSREIFTIANKKTADHEVMHGYLAADHDFRNRLVQGIMESELAEAFEKAKEAAAKKWAHYAADMEFDVPNEEIRNWQFNYAVANEVLCEARAGNTKLGAEFMRKLIPYVQKETAKWEQEWDAAEHKRIVLESDPTFEEMMEAFGESIDDGFEDPYAVERYLPSGELDSEGNELSVEQSKRFANSKLRGRDGKLLRLFHGTEDWGFTIFQRSKSDNSGPFFLSDSIDTAYSYSGTRAVRSAVKPSPDWSELTVPELVEAYNWLMEENIELLDEEGVMDKIDTRVRNLNRWAGYAKALVEGAENMAAYTVDGKPLYSEADAAGIRALAKVLPDVVSALETAVTADDYLWASAELYDALFENHDFFTDVKFSHRNPLMKLLSAVRDPYEIYMMAKQTGALMEAADSGAVIYDGRNNRVVTEQQLIGKLEDLYQGDQGNYPVYAYAENPLIIEADGALWREIRVPEEIREEFVKLHGREYGSTREIGEYAESHGYDAVMIRDLEDLGKYAYDYDDEATVVMVFKPEQIKDAYNLSPTDDPDIRYDLPENADHSAFKAKFDEMYGAGSADALFAAAEAAFSQASKAAPPASPASQADDEMLGWVTYGRSVGSAALRFDPYSYLQNEYGTIEQTGRNNARVVDVPKSTNGRDKVSKTTSTVMGAKATPDDRLGDIAQAVVDGDLSYYPTKNKIAENKARARIRKVGYKDALSEWTEAVDSGKVNSNLVAMGATLLNNAGNSDMTGRSYTSLLAKYAQLLRNAGQALQAANIFKRMSPEAKLYTVARQVEEINQRHDTGLPVSMWMDEVGELLADEIYKMVDVKEPRAKVKSVADTVLEDLRKYASELVARESVTGATTTRTELERLQDMFDNKDKYAEAWQVAKNRLADEFGSEPNIYAALEAWVNSELTLAPKLTKILTNQNEVVMDEALAEEYLAAKTDEERDAAMDRILQNIADQIPATFMDKFTALRYTGMLGNLRTNVRNVAGNSLMQPVLLVKNTFAGLAEALIQKAGVDIERTNSLIRDVETFKAAKDDFKNVQDIIAAGGKYQDNHTDISQEIRKRQRIFKNAALEGMRKGSGWLLENEYFGDARFSSFTYADALARYIAANGTTWPQASEELKDKARAVAIREAAEATYRDNNALSEAISRMRFRNPDTWAKKGLNLLAEGILPFRKTPANILMRSVEYSPLGLAAAMTQTVRKAANKSDVTAAELINSFSKGLTGTGIILAGMALASMGYLKGKGPDDEKEKELWEMQGHQDYSLEVDGTSYTIDWASPLSIPLLVGAELHEALLSEGLTLREATGVVSAVFDPLLEMSMLQGINDAISNAQTYGDESALVRFVGNALWSYVTQPIPTLLGQVERSGANARMTTYVDKNKDIPDAVQRALGKASAKLPGWDYAQVQYVDAWGRTQKNADTQTLNVIEQFLSPGYANAITETEMEKELLRLKQATGESSVLIKSAPKYFNVDKVRKDLTADEYFTYAKTRGQTAFSVVTDITEDQLYSGMTDAEKVTAVSKAYDFANQVAKELVTNGKAVPEKWVREAQAGAAEYGIPVSTYLSAYAMTKDLTGIPGKDGKSVDNSKSLRVMDKLYSIPGLSKEQVMKLAEDFDVSEKIRKYNARMVQSKLAALEKKYG